MSCVKTYNEAQLFVVSGVHGLAFFNAATVVGLTLDVKSNPAQLEDDVPLSLYKHRYETLLFLSLILISQSQKQANNSYMFLISLFLSQSNRMIQLKYLCPFAKQLYNK